MKRYYIEHGPYPHPRVFVNDPPKRPMGPVVCVTEETWKTLKDTHPKFWIIEDGKVRVAKTKVTERLLKYLPWITGVVGFVLGRLV